MQIIQSTVSISKLMSWEKQVIYEGRQGDGWKWSDGTNVFTKVAPKHSGDEDRAKSQRTFETVAVENGGAGTIKLRRQPSIPTQSHPIPTCGKSEQL